MAENERESWLIQLFDPIWAKSRIMLVRSMPSPVQLSREALSMYVWVRVIQSYSFSQSVRQSVSQSMRNNRISTDYRSNMHDVAKAVAPEIASSDFLLRSHD